MRGRRTNSFPNLLSIRVTLAAAISTQSAVTWTSRGRPHRLFSSEPHFRTVMQDTIARRFVIHDVQLLARAIVRQTATLIAQLLAATGMRVSLAQLADEAFLVLSRELEEQGLSRKIIADMFGMSLRSYQRRVPRLREGKTTAGRTLWESLAEHLRAEGRVTRSALLQRFAEEDPEAIGAVLNDLYKSGLISRSGSAGYALFSVKPDQAHRWPTRDSKVGAATALVWLELCRDPEAPTSAISKRLGLEQEVVSAALAALRDQGRISSDSQGRQIIQPMTVPFAAETGWEAAVFDHFRAVTLALTSKLQGGRMRSVSGDTTGGATLTFDVYPGHPSAPRVLELLHRTRAELKSLWREVEDYNATHPPPEGFAQRVTFYFGQVVAQPEKPQE